MKRSRSRLAAVLGFVGVFPALVVAALLAFEFSFPADGSSVDYLQPVILTPSGQVAFWFDAPPSPETLARQWSILGRPPSAIFPVTFRCRVPVDGRTVGGSIEGVEVSPEAAPGLPATPSRRRGVGTRETRTIRRHAKEMTVEFVQGSLRGTGITGNVSRRGMFVRSDLLPGTGPVLRLTVNLPGGRKLALKGRVVRSVASGPSAAAPTGFGLRLVEDWPEYDDLFGRRRKK